MHFAFQRAFLSSGLPGSATADDIWLQRGECVDRARAKIVTSGTFFVAPAFAKPGARSFIGARARCKTCRL
jgi:hypothetical protein